VWFFPRKTRYTAGEALEFLRKKKALPEAGSEQEDGNSVH
jgi:hypothetical protein